MGDQFRGDREVNFHAGERVPWGAGVPVRFVGLVGWESGEVRLCRLPTSSEGEVGSEDTGGVCARRDGSKVVVG